MKIIIQNLAIEYSDKGTGQVLLFLHGWQDNLHTFDSLISFLPLKWRIIQLDLPGFGESETPKETWNLDNYILFVEDFIKKLDVQVYALVSHSFGGRIALKAMAKKSLKAQKIILIASAGIAKSQTFRNSSLRFLAKIGGLVFHVPPLIFFRERLRRIIYDLVGSDYLSAGALKKSFLKIIAEDLSSSAKKIKIPTLLIWGENDAETPISDGKRFAKLIPNSKLALIRGAGHFVHQERSQEVASFVKKFL